MFDSISKLKPFESLVLTDTQKEIPLQLKQSKVTGFSKSIVDLNYAFKLQELYTFNLIHCKTERFKTGKEKAGPLSGVKYFLYIKV